MQECYLVREHAVEGWVPVMICAARYEADVIAEAFGEDETGNPNAEVVSLPYTP